MKCPQCNGARMATYTSALTRFQPHSEPFESGVLEKIEEIETYVDVGVHHCLDCGHELFWLEDPRSPLEAEVKRLQAKLQKWHDWERAWVFGPDEGVPWPGNPGTVDPVTAANDAGEEVGRLRGALKHVEHTREPYPAIGVPFCPWCGTTKAQGHRFDCMRQAALEPAP